MPGGGGGGGGGPVSLGVLSAHHKPPPSSARHNAAPAQSGVREAPGLTSLLLGWRCPLFFPAISITCVGSRLPCGVRGGVTFGVARGNEPEGGATGTPCPGVMRTPRGGESVGG